MTHRLLRSTLGTFAIDQLIKLKQLRCNHDRQRVTIDKDESGRVTKQAHLCLDCQKKWSQEWL